MESKEIGLLGSYEVCPPEDPEIQSHLLVKHVCRSMYVVTVCI